MFFSDSIILRSSTFPTPASARANAPTIVDTPVWANKVSTTRSEFYAAGAIGIDAVQTYEVHVEDWNNQNMVIDGTKEYYIKRDYLKGLGVVVLTCSDKAV